jgi:hypothetical protein
MSSSGSPTTKGINEQIAVSSNIPNKGEGRKGIKFNLNGNCK